MLNDITLIKANPNQLGLINYNPISIKVRILDLNFSLIKYNLNDMRLTRDFFEIEIEDNLNKMRLKRKFSEIEIEDYLNKMRLKRNFFEISTKIKILDLNLSLIKIKFKIRFTKKLSIREPEDSKYKNILNKSKDIILKLTLSNNIILQNNHNIEQEKFYWEKKREMLFQNDISRARQFLSATKEWSSSIYSYNRNEMRSLWGTDQSISKIIQSYFTSIPYWFITTPGIKRAVIKKWRSKTNKVYISKSEFKHTSSKVTITLYIFAEREVNLRYMYKFIDKDNFLYSIAKNKGLLTFYNFIHNYPDLAETSLFINKVKKKFYQYLKLELNYRKLKNFLVNKISLSYYKKKVVINIIRLKYLYLNNKMITEYIVLKLIQKKRHIFKAKKKIFGLIRLPYINKYDVNQITLAKKRIIMKSFRNQLPVIRGKHIWFDWKKNKYFRPLVMDNHRKINDTYKDFLLYINYKYPIGIRLQIAGRLTKRNVASRSLKKFTYLGSIKNIDASFRKISVSNLRTCFRPNIEFNKINSFARTGAFTVRSWLSNY